MALERKDVRLKFAADRHPQLVFEAEQDGMDIGEWVEQLVLRELDRRAEDSIKRARFVERLGISGKTGERQG